MVEESKFRGDLLLPGAWARLGAEFLSSACTRCARKR